MADTREKLIELLMDMPFGRATEEEETAHIEAVADYLIENGVIVGKPLTEYLHPVDGYEGLKGKYLVFKADSGEQVTNCFVLRPDKDTSAVEALRAYANNTTNQTLSEDIHNWVGKGITVQEWIPVTERLPDNICPVLVALEGINAAFHGWYQDEKWWTVGAGSRPFTQKVTHWMPLPEPPKGE